MLIPISQRPGPYYRRRSNQRNSSYFHRFKDQTNIVLPPMTTRNFNVFLFVCLFGFASISMACQPIPATQMELIRERFRESTILFPPPALQNLTSSQVRALNETIDKLIRLQHPDQSIPSEIEQEFLNMMRRERIIN